MISPQYREQFGEDVFHHYRSISSTSFWWNILYLRGSYGDIVTLRNKYINGEKLESYERKQLRNVMTKEMKEWEEERYMTLAADNAEGILSSITDRIKFKIDKSRTPN